MRYVIRAALVAALLIPLRSSAFDSEKWGHDDATREWFKSLKSPIGIPCCDYSDGTRVEAPDYTENNDGSFEVFVWGRWVHVAKDHVVSASNRIGYAVLWGNAGIDTVYCFMPGARG